LPLLLPLLPAAAAAAGRCRQDAKPPSRLPSRQFIAQSFVVSLYAGIEHAIVTTVQI
jgi:hypothetical protein